MKMHLALLVSVMFLSLLVSLNSQIISVYSTRSGIGYTPVDTMLANWKALCDGHPGEASYVSIGKTILGRDIWLFKIGNPSGGKVMYDAECHGSEDGGTEDLFKFATWLLESNDPLANHILQWNYLLIIPILNVDGAIAGTRWNGRTNYTLPNGTVLYTQGVDINRNGIYGWGQSGSTNPFAPSGDYMGLYAGSEPETQAYHNAVIKYKPAVYVDIHTGDERIYQTENTGVVEQRILGYMSYYKQIYGVTYSYPISNGLSGGMIAVDAHATDDASAWLLEVCNWTDLPPTLNDFLTTWYPRDFPILLSFAKAVEIAPAHAGDIHDIAVTNIACSKTVVFQGFSANINVTVANQGDFTETFNVTAYANTTSVASQNVTLSSGDSTTIAFTWNTTGFAYGNYTLGAYASPVPGETDTSNNNCTGGWVIVSFVGDLTGPRGWPDGKVEMEDVNYVAKRCSTTPSSPMWDPNCDVTGPTSGVPDGKVDIKDVHVVALHYGDHYP